MSSYPLPVPQHPPSTHRIRRAFLQITGKIIGLHPTPRPGTTEKILVIRPDHMGDLLFAMPAIGHLRELYPEAEIVGMIGPWGKAVWERLPEFDRIITCPFPGFTRQPKGNPLAPYRLLIRCAKSIRGEGFDTAFVMRFDHWWGALMAAVAGIPRRIGYDRPDVRPFLTDPISYRPGRHEAIQNWALIEGTPEVDPASVGPLFFPVPEDARGRANRLLESEGIGGDDPILVVHPGSGSPIKRWMPEKWAYVTGLLLDRTGAKLVITGGASERSLAEEVADACRHPSAVIAGRTDLDVLAAVLARAMLVMGPDSGPLHLAVAVGTPTVALYGPADPTLFGPWGPPERHKVVMSEWPCAPCGRLDFPPEEIPEHRCVQEIPAEAVVRAATEALSAARTAMSPP